MCQSHAGPQSAGGLCSRGGTHLSHSEIAPHAHLLTFRFLQHLEAHALRKLVGDRAGAAGEVRRIAHVGGRVDEPARKHVACRERAATAHGGAVAASDHRDGLEGVLRGGRVGALRRWRLRLEARVLRGAREDSVCDILYIQFVYRHRLHPGTAGETERALPRPGAGKCHACAAEVQCYWSMVHGEVRVSGACDVGADSSSVLYGWADGDAGAPRGEDRAAHL